MRPFGDGIATLIARE